MNTSKEMIEWTVIVKKRWRERKEGESNWKSFAQEKWKGTYPHVNVEGRDGSRKRGKSNISNNEREREGERREHVLIPTGGSEKEGLKIK